MKGYARVAAAVPHVGVSNMSHNLERTLSLWQQADTACASLVVFPELGLCGYSVRDLMLNTTLLDACEDSLDTLIERSRSLTPMAIVGLPVRSRLGLFNCAAAIQNGKLLGIVPKAYLPNYREFEEARWFRPGTEASDISEMAVGTHVAPFGLDLLFESSLRDLTVGIEVCEDNWVQLPPSSYQVSAGATVICNLSASNFTLGKAELRRLLAKSSSDRGKCAYLYVAAGPGESSTDVTFDADAFICENGSVLAESKRFSREDQLIVQDIDLDALAFERRSTNSFGDCAHANARTHRRIPGNTCYSMLGDLRDPKQCPGHSNGNHRQAKAGTGCIRRPGFHPRSTGRRRSSRSARAATRGSVVCHDARLWHQ